MEVKQAKTSKESAKISKSATKHESVAKLNVNILSQSGETISSLDLLSYFPATELTEGYSPSFVHQILLSYLDNQRQATAKTKSRAEVRGGGKKPWRQKGTGRARVGSNRSPLWRHGGVSFGPRGNQNFTKSLTKKARQKACRYSILQFIVTEKIAVLDKLPSDIDKTKKIVQIINKLPIGSRNLIILDKESLSLTRFIDNLDTVRAISSMDACPLDLFKSDYLICTKVALEEFLTRQK